MAVGVRGPLPVPLGVAGLPPPGVTITSTVLLGGAILPSLVVGGGVGGADMAIFNVVGVGAEGAFLASLLIGPGIGGIAVSSDIVSPGLGGALLSAN